MRRLSRLFREDGNMVVVAMDHGLGLSVNPALDDIGAKLRAIIKGGADAILTTYGIARTYEDILKDTNLILRLDAGIPALTATTSARIKCLILKTRCASAQTRSSAWVSPDRPMSISPLNSLRITAAKATRWGSPSWRRCCPADFRPLFRRRLKTLSLQRATGCECGAHIIKTAFAGDAESYKKVIAASYQPVIVLGGEAVKDPSSLYVCIEQAMQAGAHGVAIGRNVWKSSDPERVTRDLVRLVHEGAKANDIRMN
jgi:class I fructose-bisphosphate aldolase